MSKRGASMTSGTGAIRCPLFLAHKANEIQCEGPEDGCRHIFRYKDTETKKRQMEVFCSGRYSYCEWYQTLERMRE